MPKNKFWQFKNATETTGELLLYGVIESYSWWGDEITPKQFKKDLDALGEIDVLNVYINSPGGDVFAGQAIHSMLKRHKAKVTVSIDGLAASAASVIAMAGDTVYMPRNAMMMIHNPWTCTCGEAADFRKMADDLDKIRESIVAVYADKTGMEDAKIIELMDAETWLTADDAAELGFADEIEAEKQVAASIREGKAVINGVEMDFSQFKNPPKLVFLPPESPEKPDPPDDNPKEEQVPDLLSLCQQVVDVRKKKYAGGTNA